MMENQEIFYLNLNNEEKTMRLRKIAFTASGTRNFFGEGWPHHKYFKLLFPRGFNFSGATLITKTTTLNPRMPMKDEKGKGMGNLVLNPKTLQPVEFMPDCIKANPITGSVLNAVGLTGPGAEALFKKGIWQEMTSPFLISFMAMGTDREQRLRETEDFVRIFRQYLPGFEATVGLEINNSCPNVEHGAQGAGAEEILEQLEITSVLGIPQGLKINVLTPIGLMVRVANGGHLDFIDIPNTLPFGKLPEYVDWMGKFGHQSPLAQYGGGGYSGSENFERAVMWVHSFRKHNFHAKIILGGVFCKKDVLTAKRVGANAVSIARVTMTRPWRVAGIIKKANQVFGG